MSMTKTLCLVLLPLGMASGAHAQIVEPDPINGAGTAPYIRSALPLDEPRHLCIDVPGHGDRVDLGGEVTVHTCKDGMWNLDQRFQWARDGSALEMPQYAQCLVASAAEPGRPLLIGDCGSDLAAWDLAQSRLVLSADPTLCVTIADGMSELTPGGRRFPERYRARALALELCSDEAMERQLWSVTQPLELPAALLPPSGSLPFE